MVTAAMKLKDAYFLEGKLWRGQATAAPPPRRHQTRAPPFRTRRQVSDKPETPGALSLGSARLQGSPRPRCQPGERREGAALRTGLRDWEGPWDVPDAAILAREGAHSGLPLGFPA